MVERYGVVARCADLRGPNWSMMSRWRRRYVGRQVGASHVRRQAVRLMLTGWGGWTARQVLSMWLDRTIGHLASRVEVFMTRGVSTMRVLPLRTIVYRGIRCVLTGIKILCEVCRSCRHRLRGVRPIRIGVIRWVHSTVWHGMAHHTRCRCSPRNLGLVAHRAWNTLVLAHVATV